MKKQTILMLIIAVLLLASCSVQKRMDRKCEKAQRKYELASYKYGCPWKITDSILIRETVTKYRDTLVYFQLPGDTVRDSILIPQLLAGDTSILKTKYALSKAWIENNKLRHTLQQIKSDIGQIIQGLTEKITVTETKTVKVPYPVVRTVERDLSWLQRFFIWSGAIAWGLLIAVVIYRFKRFITFPKWFD